MFLPNEIPLLGAALETYDDFVLRSDDPSNIHAHIWQLIPKLENYCSMTYLTQKDLTTLFFAMKYVIDIAEETGTWLDDEHYLLCEKIYNQLET